MWSFARKKKITIPIPPSAELLKFPKPLRTERVIQPEKLKAAVGLGKLPLSEFPSSPLYQPEPAETFYEKPALIIKKPFFLRVQHYQFLLDNLDGIKNQGEKLDLIAENLVKSEFNENKDYESLKNDLKRLHDRLLFMDDLIFKNR